MNTPHAHLSEADDTEEVGYWLKVKREASVESLKPLEEAAKQIVVITSLLQGIYFASISVSEIKKANSTSDAAFNVFISLSLVTIAVWMASLFFATRVFIPEVYDASALDPSEEEMVKELRIAFTKTSTYKYNNLKWAVKLLRFSFLPFIINVYVYLAWLKVPPPK